MKRYVQVRIKPESDIELELIRAKFVELNLLHGLVIGKQSKIDTLARAITEYRKQIEERIEAIQAEK